MARWHRLPAPARTFLIIAGVVVLYAAFTVGIAARMDRLHLLAPALYARTSLLVLGSAAVFWVLGYLLWVMLWVHPPRPLTWALQHLRERVQLPRRLLRGVPVILILMPFFGLFTSVKAMIPVLAPFAWDPFFFSLDRWLFGADPWTYFAALYGWPAGLRAVNFLYNLWFFVLSGVLYWQALTLRRDALRLQFFLSFLCSWVLIGSVLAVLLSSAGPCFYGQLVAGVDPYGALMAKLASANQASPVWAFGTQQMLWKAYTQDTLGVGAGISAMPSMHVAMAMLFMLLGWRVNRWLGVALGIYLVVILLGSVILAWHYAVDGVVALVLAGLIWAGAGRLARRLLA